MDKCVDSVVDRAQTWVTESGQLWDLAAVEAAWCMGARDNWWSSFHVKHRDAAHPLAAERN